MAAGGQHAVKLSSQRCVTYASSPLAHSWPLPPLPPPTATPVIMCGTSAAAGCRRGLCAQNQQDDHSLLQALMTAELHSWEAEQHGLAAQVCSRQTSACPGDFLRRSATGDIWDHSTWHGLRRRRAQEAEQPEEAAPAAEHEPGEGAALAGRALPGAQPGCAQRAAQRLLGSFVVQGHRPLVRVPSLPAKGECRPVPSLGFAPPHYCSVEALLTQRPPRDDGAEVLQAQQD